MTGLASATGSQLPRATTGQSSEPVRTRTGPALTATTWRCENCGHDSPNRRRRCADWHTSRH
jgi:hypothetical protein